MFVCTTKAEVEDVGGCSVVILPRALHFLFVLILQSKLLFNFNLFPVYSAPPLFSAGVLFDLSGNLCASVKADRHIVHNLM